MTWFKISMFELCVFTIHIQIKLDYDYKYNQLYLQTHLFCHSLHLMHALMFADHDFVFTGISHKFDIKMDLMHL